MSTQEPSGSSAGFLQLQEQITTNLAVDSSAGQKSDMGLAYLISGVRGITFLSGGFRGGPVFLLI